MRLCPGLIVALATTLSTLPAALAAETDASARRFVVSAHATLTKQWTYTSTSAANGCTSRVRASGSRTIVLRTSELSAVFGSWAGAAARARFSGPIRIGGTVTQSGTKTRRVTGAAPCDTGTHRLSCVRLRRTFANRTIALVSRRPHRIGFTPLRGVVAPPFFNACPGEPTEIRLLSNGLEIADAGYEERELFDPSTGGYSVRGRADVTTRVFNPPGRVVQHIRWTLLFRRVG